ncbi:MAG: GNAT family N-acetyltransferase [Roseiarcus sp.]|uniref:GNAT family N-acetyltransferase n=1 Tax=Roseiarcus sp. TaxID=1969460 RepID=UPI003C540BA7
MTLKIRPATPSDRRRLRAAVVELHECERRLHSSRLPGEETADAYLDWMLAEARQGGAVLVAEVCGAFAGLAAGWIAQENLIEETPDSNRYGYVSDICVLPPFRGRRIASALLEALEARLRQGGVTRIRLSALAANAAARKVYERSGYTLYEVVYEKRVGADNEDSTS